MSPTKVDGERAGESGSNSVPAVHAASGVGAAAMAIAVAILGWRAVVMDRTVDARAPVALASSKVDLNSAGAAELALLPEIGPSVADAILADRAARGRFASVEELGRVRGIGPATIAAIRPYALASAEAGASGGK